jgi:hypothetical protein
MQAEAVVGAIRTDERAKKVAAASRANLFFTVKLLIEVGVVA